MLWWWKIRRFSILIRIHKIKTSSLVWCHVTRDEMLRYFRMSSILLSYFAQFRHFLQFSLLCAMGRRKSSVVWDHFTRKALVNGNKKTQVATCKICQTDTKFSRNTTNQFQDLRLHHPEAYQLVQPHIQLPPKRSKGNGDLMSSGLLDDTQTEDNMSIGSY